MSNKNTQKQAQNKATGGRLPGPRQGQKPPPSKALYAKEKKEDRSEEDQS